jgi:hypothetical protein
MEKHQIGDVGLFTCGLLVVVNLVIGTDNGARVVDQVTVPYPPPTVECTGNGCESTIVSSNWSYIPLVANRFPPPATNSYYIWTTQDFWGLGCDIGTKLGNLSGDQDGFVFLDFGNPNQDSQARLGTILYNQSPISTDDIASAVVVFSQGFYYCSQIIGATDSLKIAVGTNSSGGTVTDVIAFQHGEAWSNLVIEINDRFLDYQGLTSRVVAVGGINVEPNFNPVYVPQHWMEGYNSVTDTRRQVVYVIGSADECPLDFPPSILGTYTPGDCFKKYNGGVLVYKWTQEDIRNISWGFAMAWPFPEIYNSATADQWYRISLLSRFNHNSPMYFRGVITQLGACEQLREQNPGVQICVGTDYAPNNGFLALYGRIQSDQYTVAGNHLKWSTDIRNYYGP